MLRVLERKKCFAWEQPDGSFRSVLTRVLKLQLHKSWGDKKHRIHLGTCTAGTPLTGRPSSGVTDGRAGSFSGWIWCSECLKGSDELRLHPGCWSFSGRLVSGPAKMHSGVGDKPSTAADIPALCTDATLNNIAAVQTLATGACRTNYTVK